MIDKRLTISKRRICYVNPDSRTMETSVSFFEKRLSMISNLDLAHFTSLETAQASGPCDLLILNANNLDEQAFLQWFPKIVAKLSKKEGIPSPCIFFSQLEFNALESIWETAYKHNWYFDIVQPQHMESLPIRVANLLRIHDHIHEIRRYEEELNALKGRMSSLEKKLEKNKRNEHD